MSKKVAVASIICLVLGVVSLPGGIILHDYITDLTYNSVDEGLLGIKDKGVPIVKEQLFQLGPASAFQIIKEKAPETSIPLVNATIFMNQIYTVESITSYPLLPTQTLFFDEVNATTMLGLLNFSSAASYPGIDFPPVKGISEWIGTDLNFTKAIETSDFTGLNNLKYGVETNESWWGDRLPGIYEDTYRRVGDEDWPPEIYPDDFSDSINTVDVNQDRGFGLLEILNLIESANETQIEELCGPDGYNFTQPDDQFKYKGDNYTKLEIFYFYYNDYFVLDVFAMILAQLNEEGSKLWIDYPQYRPRDWNGNDTSYDDLAYYSFIEQWVKGNSYDEGVDLHDAEPNIDEGTYGLEPGGPNNDSGIPIQAALKLWNESSEYSFVNFPIGIEKWYNAYSGDYDAYDELLNHFNNFSGYVDDYPSSSWDWNENDTYGEYGWGFNETDMDLILDWIWGNGGGWNNGGFSSQLLPPLIEANYNKTLDEFSFQILLEVWTNGTIMGYSLYPEGYPLPLGFKDLYGFELGYQGGGQPVIPSNISLESAYKLWNESSEYSLVTKKGIKKWFSVIHGNNDTYQILKNENGLTTNKSMDLILDWLVNFQHNLMPYLAQYEYNLPIDSISLANIIQLSGFIIGGITLPLGSAGLIRNYLVKRKMEKNKGFPE